jgi:hypothetical protein
MPEGFRNLLRSFSITFVTSGGTCRIAVPGRRVELADLRFADRWALNTLPGGTASWNDVRAL